MTVADAFDAYIDAKVLTPTTVKTFRAAKRYAVEQGIGAIKLANLRPSHVDAYTAHLVRAGLAPRTVNLKAAKLNAVLRFAAADGGLAFAPKAVKVKVSEVKRQAITAADVKALFEAASEDFAPAIILGAYCGLRASEAAGLTVGDINFTTGEVSITKAANDAGEYVRTKTPRSVRVIPVPRRRARPAPPVLRRAPGRRAGRAERMGRRAEQPVVLAHVRRGGVAGCQTSEAGARRALDALGEASGEPHADVVRAGGEHVGRNTAGSTRSSSLPRNVGHVGRSDTGVRVSARFGLGAEPRNPW